MVPPYSNTVGTGAGGAGAGVGAGVGTGAGVVGDVGADDPQAIATTASVTARA